MSIDIRDAHIRRMENRYEDLLLFVKKLYADIREQSNIGDELCADLIHEVIVPLCPAWLLEELGLDTD